MGLDALFVTSGFLVTASLANRGDLISFFWARALRVYPGLWVMLAAHGFRPRAGADDAAAPRLLRVRHDLDLLLQMRDADRRHSLFAARRVRLPAAQGRVQRLALDHAGRGQDVHLRRRALDRLRAPARLAQKGDAVRLSGGCRPVLGDRRAWPLFGGRVQRREYPHVHVPLRIGALFVARPRPDGRRHSRSRWLRRWSWRPSTGRFS